MSQKSSTQHYLECVGKLQDHFDALEDIRNDFLAQSPLTTHIEGLQDQLEAAEVCPSLQICFFANASHIQMLFHALFFSDFVHLLYYLDIFSFISIYHLVSVYIIYNPKHFCF